MTMAENGFPLEGGPISVMLLEHEQGRKLTRAMHEATLKLVDDPAARVAVIENALGYAALMKQHIMKETNVLFPMADRLIPAKDQEKMTESFEHEETGEGVHEKYLALANALDQEAANL